MDPFSMVVTIVLISVAGKLIGNYLKLRQQELAARGAPGMDASTERELAALRERVATLERIVTEPAYDLKRQFHELEREQRRAA